MLSQAMTTNSLPHNIMTKTTEKSYILLHNSHGNSTTTTNHHHCISPVIPVSSIHCNTMDQSTSIASKINSHPPVHPTATLTLGTLTSPNSNPFLSPIPYCPNLPLQHQQMRDTTVNYITNVTALIPNEPTAVPATNTSTLLTKVNVFHAQMEKTHVVTQNRNSDSTVPGDLFEDQMWQQQCRFFADLAKLERNLLLAQQEFNKKMQIFIAHCNAMRESHQVHLSAHNQPNSILHPATT